MSYTADFKIRYAVWAAQRTAGEACVESGRSVEALAALVGQPEETIRRWIFMAQTGAYMPTDPVYYARILRKMLKQYTKAQVATKIDRTEAWIDEILLEIPDVAVSHL